MKTIRIGLAGLGTVGKGFYDILHKDSKILQERSGVIFEITAVANRSKKDFVDSKIKFYSNIVDLAKDENVDVIIEAMGGKDVALDLILTAFENGKKVVTFIRKFEKFYPAENYHQDYYQESLANYLMYKKACGREEQLKKIWQ